MPGPPGTAFQEPGKDAALILQRAAIGKEENFVNISWGPTPVSWLNADKLQDSLGTLMEELYRQVEDDVSAE